MDKQLFYKSILSRDSIRALTEIYGELPFSKVLYDLVIVCLSDGFEEYQRDRDNLLQGNGFLKAKKITDSLAIEVTS